MKSLPCAAIVLLPNSCVIIGAPDCVTTDIDQTVSLQQLQRESGLIIRRIQPMIRIPATAFPDGGIVRGDLPWSWLSKKASSKKESEQRKSTAPLSDLFALGRLPEISLHSLL